MISGEELIAQFERNTRVLNLNLAGVSHDKSIARPVEGANSINWIVGHLLHSRLDLLELFDVKLEDVQPLLEPYRRDREQGYEDRELLPLVELKSLWEQVEVRLFEHLATADPSIGAADFGSFGQAALFYSFHEAYHTGQAGLLRRAIGLEGQVR